MNCFSARQKPGIWRLGLIALGFAVSACNAEPEPEDREYRLDFVVTPMPEAAAVAVSMEVSQGRHWLREVEFDFDTRYSDFEGDGQLDIGSDTVKWSVPKRSGSLNWTVQIPNRRGNSFDAYMDIGWAIFRAEDIIPRKSSVTAVDVTSKTTLRFDLPAGWSATTPYRERRGVFSVENPDRRLDLPSGWIAMGSLGTRFDTVGSTRVVVTGPSRQGVRRMDMLALLRWNLPELERILPAPMRRLTVVSGGDPMWRGGLSAPTSLFIHADLPLISENGTSLLLHEVMHVAMNLKVADGHDWIHEGLAEYFSIELMRRSGTISDRRYRRAIRELREWSKDVESVCGRESTGPVTAAGVTLLSDLNAELAENTEKTIDDLLYEVLSRDEPVNTQTVRDIAETLLGSPSKTLSADILGNCSD
ncbi:MAG: hypothetical protein QNJ19_15270 [Woeseiaceae bacterium]|nr:hypothetical protein [Woeseiaceae bacterium]